jgi:hypothetical protein
VLVAGCATVPASVVEEPPEPERSGTASLVDFQPKNSPSIVGDYGFELLDEVQGTRCMRRAELGRVEYWLMFSGMEKISKDGFTRQVVVAAAYDALSHLEDADTIVVTRAVATGDGPDRICATVHGRGVRLIKHEPPDESK